MRPDALNDALNELDWFQYDSLTLVSWTNQGIKLLFSYFAIGQVKVKLKYYMHPMFLHYNQTQIVHETNLSRYL